MFHVAPWKSPAPGSPRHRGAATDDLDRDAKSLLVHRPGRGQARPSSGAVGGKHARANRVNSGGPTPSACARRDWKSSIESALASSRVMREPAGPGPRPRRARPATRPGPPGAPRARRPRARGRHADDDGDEDQADRDRGVREHHRHGYHIHGRNARATPASTQVTRGDPGEAIPPRGRRSDRPGVAPRLASSQATGSLFRQTANHVARRGRK